MLEALVSPLTPDRFLGDHWPERPYWSPDGEQRLRLLTGIPELASSEAVFAGASRVNYFKPDGTTGAVAGSDAGMVHRLGLTCFLGGGHVPALMTLAEELAADLGLPSGSMTAEVFCSDGTGGSPMHSDHDVNFAVLLSGHKRWQIAENTHIRNQTALCRAHRQEDHDPRQLELADRLPFPSEMPPGAIDVEVGPGGLLFLPRGWWHRTTSAGECLQVNFVLTRPMWVTVLTKALGRRLERDPAWRAFTFDLFGPPERRAMAMAELAGLLEGLRADLATVDAEELARQVVGDAGLRPARRAADGPEGA